MRKLAIALAVASVAGAASGAQAADLGGYQGSMKDEPYVAAPTAIWSGLYIGGHLGGIWSDKSKSNGYNWDWCEKEWEKANWLKFSDDDDKGLIGGVHVGYNWQSGAKVFGVEGDVSFGDGVDYLASVRARLGHSVDNFLFYVTAGVAFAGFDDQTVKLTSPWHETFKFDGDTKVGAVVGGGAEYKLAANWSVGVEGLYYFFGDSKDSETFGYYDGLKLNHETDNDMFVVRGRLTYHFTDDRYDAPLK
jgi:outer membrane immunogenic protein